GDGDREERHAAEDIEGLDAAGGGGHPTEANIPPTHRERRRSQVRDRGGDVVVLRIQDEVRDDTKIVRAGLHGPIRDAGARRSAGGKTRTHDVPVTARRERPHEWSSSQASSCSPQLTDVLVQGRHRSSASRVSRAGVASEQIGLTVSEPYDRGGTASELSSNFVKFRTQGAWRPNCF